VFIVEIRNVTWKGFQEFSMPVPEFINDVLNMSDAINWSHWKPMAVTFAGVTQTANQWYQNYQSLWNLLNEAERAETTKRSKERPH
jgi:hypothetical protein